MSKSFKNNNLKRKPDWLKVKIPAGDGFSKIKKRVLKSFKYYKESYNI